MQRGTFVRDGLRLSVARTGSGRPLIFQHGLGGDAGQPADVFPEHAGWQAVTLECRGHGQSEAGPADAFRIATFADDVAALIEAEGLAPLPLAGISMGAAIGLRIAATRPELVSALVLARPAWLDRAGPANMARRRHRRAAVPHLRGRPRRQPGADRGDPRADAGDRQPARCGASAGPRPRDRRRHPDRAAGGDHVEIRRPGPLPQRVPRRPDRFPRGNPRMI